MVVACPLSSGLSAVSFFLSFFTLLFYSPIYVNTIRRLSYIETHVSTIRKHRPCFSPKGFCQLAFYSIPVQALIQPISFKTLEQRPEEERRGRRTERQREHGAEASF